MFPHVDMLTPGTCSGTEQLWAAEAFENVESFSVCSVGREQVLCSVFLSLPQYLPIHEQVMKW